MSDLAADLGVLMRQSRDIARDAGAAIMEIYHSDFAVEHKVDDSPLTAADMAAHHLIVDRLQAISDWRILSEESKAVPFSERSQWTTYWLVDPLDGTKEFVKRNDQFTVNIALIHEHKPVLGVVFAPALALMYYAAVGEQAWKEGADGHAVQIACRELDPDNLVLSSSKSQRNADLEAFLSRIGPHRETPVGSSLKFCIVAEGKADLYPRIGLTSEWDTAAAQCVVEQAGGHVTTIEMKPLTYNTKDDLLNPWFFVFGKTWTDWSAYL